MRCGLLRCGIHTRARCSVQGPDPTNQDERCTASHATALLLAAQSRVAAAAAFPVPSVPGLAWPGLASLLGHTTNARRSSSGAHTAPVLGHTILPPLAAMICSHALELYTRPLGSTMGGLASFITWRGAGGERRGGGCSLKLGPLDRPALGAGTRPRKHQQPALTSLVMAQSSLECTC